MRKGHAGLLMFGVAASVFVLDVASAATPASTARAYSEGRYSIELDNLNAGWVKGAEGGHAFSEVVVEKVGPDYVAHKHIGAPKYEDITVEIGSAVSTKLLGWVRDSFGRSYIRKDGALLATDSNFKEVSRLSFYHALITEIRFPELDGAVKEQGSITLKITPEYSRTVATTAPSKAIAASPAVNANKQKQWMTTNFRLSIDGLDCTRVTRIEPVRITTKPADTTLGDQRDYTKAPTRTEFSNLVVYVPESQAKSFYDWHESFVIKGDAGDAKEKNGKLEFLSTTPNDVLFTVELKHIGIFKVSPEKYEVGTDTIRRVKVEMYVEQMAFSYDSKLQ
jgi:hypothetical protein